MLQIERLGLTPMLVQRELRVMVRAESEAVSLRTAWFMPDGPVEMQLGLR